jgi:outer membrane protein assembly factor BamB
VLWRADTLHVDHQNGPGSSPIVWNDLLIIHYDGIDEQYLAALNTENGQVVWRTDRTGVMDPKPEFQKAYCTPTLVYTERGPELISPAANWVYGYHPATGSELWKATYGDLGFSTVPKPVVGNGLAYVCTSFARSRLLAVRYGGQGDVTDSHIAWTADSQIPKKPSLMLVGNDLFVANDTGIVTCFDALSGEELWRDRIGGNYSASPIFANGLIYFFSEDGRATIVRAAREFEIVAVNELGSGFNASPAVVGDSLVVRSHSDLYRIQQSR